MLPAACCLLPSPHASTPWGEAEYYSADVRQEDFLDDRLDPLILDLVGWVAAEPRTYAEVMDAWRTSCPRLTVWEDAVDRGYLVRKAAQSGGLLVCATPLGRRFLEENGRAP